MRVILFIAIVIGLLVSGMYLTRHLRVEQQYATVQTDVGNTAEYCGIETGRVVKVYNLPVSPHSTNVAACILDISTTNRYDHALSRMAVPRMWPTDIKSGDIVEVTVLHKNEGNGGHYVCLASKLR